MTPAVPSFPWTAPPEQWDTLSLLAGTVFLEAEGEPYIGKLAVAHVLMNRVAKAGSTIPHEALNPFQFSCWNADYRIRAEARLSGAEGVPAEESWKAAAAALWALAPDPTWGARHYANIQVVRRSNQGRLPAWLQTMLDTGERLELGNHTFLREKETT